MATNYEVIEAKTTFSNLIRKLVTRNPVTTRNLVEVTDNGTVFYASKEPFGPNTFANNTAEMQQSYSHPLTLERISFQAPTTRQSILAAAREFTSIAKPKILNPRWLQLGPILRTQEGVWINPLDAQGQPTTNEQTLKQLLTHGTKVNDIYLLNHDGAFVPYDSFQQGVQEARQFAEGGLARALEHTAEKTAPNLEAMANTYPLGVNVWNFDPTMKPTLRVVGLDSGRSWGSDRLFVGGNDWGDGDGCAFGVRQ